MTTIVKCPQLEFLIMELTFSVLYSTHYTLGKGLCSMGELIINNYNKAIQITEKKNAPDIKVNKEKEKEIDIVTHRFILKGKNVWLCYGQTLEHILTVKVFLCICPEVR